MHMFWMNPALACLIIFGLASSFASGQSRATRDLVVENNSSHPQLRIAAKGRFYAVLIAVDKHDDPQITPLQFCARDATALQQVLTKSCGYDSRDVYVLATAGKVAPRKARVLNQLDDLISRLEQDDVVLIFFSGHGCLDARGNAYLVTEDAERQRLPETALAVAEVRKLLEASPARHKCLILDCCHAGGKSDVPFGAPTEQVGSELRGAKGVLTIASSQAGEHSWEWPDKGLGLFTAILIEGLSGEADSSNNERVSTLEMASYVTSKVPAQAEVLKRRQNPAILVTGAEQIPQFDLALVPNRAVREYRLPLGRDLIGKTPPTWDGDAALTVFPTASGMAITSQRAGDHTLSRSGLLLEAGSYLEWSMYVGGWGATTSLTLEGLNGTSSERFLVNRPMGNVSCLAMIEGLDRKFVGHFTEFQHHCKAEIDKEVLKFYVDGQLLQTKKISADAAYQGLSIRLSTADDRHYAARQNSSLLNLRFGRTKPR